MDAAEETVDGPPDALEAVAPAGRDAGNVDAGPLSAARLGKGFSVEDFEPALKGATYDDWLMGRDEKSTKAYRVSSPRPVLTGYVAPLLREVSLPKLRRIDIRA